VPPITELTRIETVHLARLQKQGITTTGILLEVSETPTRRQSLADHVRASTNDVLTLAWMNRESLARTVATGEAHYWSRSRKRLWKKGEQSGFVQKVREVRLDCDEDVVLLKVEQGGGIACHTGRHNCFFRKLENGLWVEIEPVLKDPKEIYAR